MGLGCMRLSTVADRDEARARETIRAALAAGIRWFDTARAYGLSDEDRGHNERLVGEEVGGAARIATKGGMRRPEGRWMPDGRARTLRTDAADSRVALGRPPDLFLLHAPDPRVPLATSVRALADV